MSAETIASSAAPIAVSVRYPLEAGALLLRTDRDWERDVEPREVVAGGTRFEFELEPDGRPFAYFKPVLRGGDGLRWATGPDLLALAGARREAYPTFHDGGGCSACDLRRLEADGAAHAYRVFYPPGYAENVLERYPVLYMQDGQNLFFPDEAFGGEHWRVPETLAVLDGMSAIRKVIVVGVYPDRRERDYTAPGYEAYARFLADALKPSVDAEFRTLPDPAHTAVMGSSLGGVVSLHAAWERPDAFGMAACLSSTFGWRDDLRARVASGSRRPLRLYLDSGWPGDNYEVTREMRECLRRSGWREGVDLLYFAFPEARHDERHWAMRSHIPYQFFFGL